MRNPFAGPSHRHQRVTSQGIESRGRIGRHSADESDVKRGTLCVGGTFDIFALVHDFDLGFAMGLIVGEGSFTGDRAQPSLEIRMHRRDLETLERVQRLLGGRVFGPYSHGGRQLYVYMLRGGELKSALPVIHENLPTSWKRVQFEAWRAKYADYLERPQPSRSLLERVQRHLAARET